MGRPRSQGRSRISKMAFFHTRKGRSRVMFRRRKPPVRPAMRVVGQLIRLKTTGRPICSNKRTKDNRPRDGGNITGLSLAVGPEIEAKRLELLGEMLPGVSRVAFLSSKEDWESPSGKSVRTAAQALGMTLVLAEHTPNQYTDAFTLISRTRSEALFVSWGPTSFVNRGLIVEFATRERLPSTFFFREPVEL